MLRTCPLVRWYFVKSVTTYCWLALYDLSCRWAGKCQTNNRVICGSEWRLLPYLYWSLWSFLYGWWPRWDDLIQVRSQVKLNLHYSWENEDHITWFVLYMVLHCILGIVSRAGYSKQKYAINPKKKWWYFCCRCWYRFW